MGLWFFSIHPFIFENGMLKLRLKGIEKMTEAERRNDHERRGSAL
jgi:hypothetical protein